MDRFNIPGFHYVKNSTALYLDTDKEPTISVNEPEELLSFRNDADRMEEHDTVNERWTLHTIGIKEVLFKGGHVTNMTEKIHINTDEEPDAAATLLSDQDYKITIADRNTAEETNTAEDYWKIHLRSIKDLFFKAKNNDVFAEFRTMYTTGTLYNYTSAAGRSWQGLNLGANAAGATADDGVLTLQLI